MGQQYFQDIATKYHLSPYAATAFGSTAVAACEAPIRTVLTLFQNGKLSVGAEKNTFGNLFTDVYKQHGVRGYFRGMPEAFGLFYTYNNLFFAQYAAFKTWCNEHYQGKTAPTYVTFPAGLFMGGAGVFIAYPYDFFMTMKQKPGNAETTREIFQRVGFKGMYAGTTFKVAHQATVTGALVFFLSSIVPWIEKELTKLSADNQRGMFVTSGLFKPPKVVKLSPSAATPGLPALSAAVPEETCRGPSLKT